MTIKQSQIRRRFDPNHLKARDVAVLAPLILAIVGLFVAFAFLVSDDTYIRWGGLTLDTCVLFGFLICHSRPVLKGRGLWALLGGFLVAHLILWVLVLKLVDQWRLAWFAPMAVEAPLFILLRDKAIPGSERSG